MGHKTALDNLRGEVPKKHHFTDGKKGGGALPCLPGWVRKSVSSIFQRKVREYEEVGRHVSRAPCGRGPALGTAGGAIEIWEEAWVSGRIVGAPDNPLI